MKRNEFIRLMGGSAASLILFNQMSCSKGDSVPVVDFFIDLLDPDFAQLQQTGGFIYMDPVIVFKAIDANYYAVSKFCTHQGCDVAYVFAFNELLCPCHGSKFDIHGQVVQGPASSPLFEYLTSLSGSTLHVFTP